MEDYRKNEVNPVAVKGRRQDPSVSRAPQQPLLPATRGQPLPPAQSQTLSQVPQDQSFPPAQQSQPGSQTLLPSAPPQEDREVQEIQTQLTQAGNSLTALDAVADRLAEATTRAFQADNADKCVNLYLLDIKLSESYAAQRMRYTVVSLDRVLTQSCAFRKNNITLAILRLLIKEQSLPQNQRREYLNLENVVQNPSWVLSQILDGNTRQAAMQLLIEFYLDTHDLDKIIATLSSGHFIWSNDSTTTTIVKDAITKMDLAVGQNRQKAEAIFCYLLEQIPTHQASEAIFKVLEGHTRLTCAIVNHRAAASNLIGAHGVRFDAGIYLVDAKGRSPMFWIKQKRDVALQEELSNTYHNNVSQIVDLFLGADQRVCRASGEQKGCTLVSGLVNDWLELKDKVFEELKGRVDDPTTSCDHLRLLQSELENPKSPLCQYFSIGHGGRFQFASPWPAKFAPLLRDIGDRLLEANIVKYDSSNEDSADELFEGSSKLQ